MNERGTPAHDRPDLQDMMHAARTCLSKLEVCLDHGDYEGAATFHRLLGHWISQMRGGEA